MKRVKRIPAAVLLAAASFIGCQHSFAECGIASTYSTGSRTANGEHYSQMGISAAHKSLPFGTRVVVRNQRTGRSITVRINDRGPFVAGRIIDLSTGAKNALGMDALASVCLEVVSYGSDKKGFRNTELREPMQAANATQPHHVTAQKVAPRLHHYVRSTAKVRYAQQGRSHHARMQPRGVRSEHHASRARQYASN